MNNRFTITANMTVPEVQKSVKAAKECFAKREDLSLAKREVIDAVIQYAENRLCRRSLLGKADNRYTIYSNILNSCDTYDDLHFAHFAVKQLEMIGAYDNSTMRQNLPGIRAKRDHLLAPEVARLQKAFMGMVAFGFGAMLTGYAKQTGAACVLLGLVGYVGSSYIVSERLERSFSIKEHRRLTSGGVNQPMLLEDGLMDEFGTFQRTAAGMLGSGLRLFGAAANQFERIANLAAAQPVPALAAANPQVASTPRIEEVSDEEAVNSRSMRK